MRGKLPTIYLQYNGKPFSIKEIAALAGVSSVSVANRLKKGWPIAEIVETPPRKRRRSSPRQIAAEAGENRFTPDKPCANGHIAQRYTASDVCVECMRINLARWKAANPARFDQLKRESYQRQKDRPEVKQTARDRAKRNRLARPEIIAVANAKRRARNAAVGGPCASADVRRLMDVAKRCAYCRKPFSGRRKKSVDHIIPLARGGTNDVTNLTICCMDCNRRKHSTTIDPASGQGLLL